MFSRRCFTHFVSLRWRAALLVVSSALGVPAWAQSDARPLVELRSSEKSLVGEPISVRAAGLPPNAKVVLFSQLVDRHQSC